MSSFIKKNEEIQRKQSRCIEEVCSDIETREEKTVITTINVYTRHRRGSGRDELLFDFPQVNSMTEIKN